MNLIVLHTTRYSETSLILHAYTQEGGRESFILKGAFGNKSRKSALSYVHPLSILNYEIRRGSKGSMKVLQEFAPEEKLDEIRTRIEKSSIAMFICELLYRGIRESTPDQALYSLLYKSIVLLNAFPYSCANFPLWFLAHFCSVLGFSPRGNYAFDFNPFTEDQSVLLDQFLEDDFIHVYAIKMNRDQRKMLIESLIRYLEFHLGIHLNIKSLDILHSIFSI